MLLGICRFAAREFATVAKKGSGKIRMDVFKQHGVIADVIDNPPKELLKLKYGGSIEVTPGMVLRPTQVQSPPTAEWKAEAGSFYTLIMNDPDAPSRKDPKFGEWHHWLVVNVPGGKLSEGQVMSEYVGSGPPKGTGLHRYVLLVYKQSGKQDFAGLHKLTNRSGDHRPKWKVREFVNKYKLGDLVAGNFYQAEWDDYVPKLYEQLSGK